MLKMRKSYVSHSKRSSEEWILFICFLFRLLKIMSDFVKSQECVEDACLNFELASERFVMLKERHGRRQNERIKIFSEVCARTKRHHNSYFSKISYSFESFS